ncbi:MAG: sigma-70 family RNA polymerase sigma factor [Spirosomataceae bacterium]
MSCVPSAGELPNFWRNYGLHVADFVRKRIRDEDVSKDLTQDIFIKIYTFCQKHDFSCEKAGVTNLRSWIFQIAQNTIVDYVRREQRFLKSEVGEEVPEVSETTAYRQAESYITPLLSLMPVAYAEPLRLADLEQLPQQEVAERLELSLSGTKSRIQRGREKLRHLLEECTYIETNEKGQVVSIEAKPTCATLSASEKKCEKKGKKDASFSMCCSS